MILFDMLFGCYYTSIGAKAYTPRTVEIKPQQGFPIPCGGFFRAPISAAVAQWDRAGELAGVRTSHPGTLVCRFEAGRRRQLHFPMKPPFKRYISGAP